MQPLVLIRCMTWIFLLLPHRRLASRTPAHDRQRILYQKIRPNANPSTNYSIDNLWQMAYEQTTFVLDTFKVTHAHLNPSMVVDPTNTSRVIFIWRYMDKGHHDKVGYNWLDRNSFQEIKNPDYVGKYRIVSFQISESSYAKFLL
jgi:hypothetical protein